MKMRLQLALDAAEHFALLPVLASYFDIVEVGTPLLKRFGVAAIATARELSNGRSILADTKTVDGGGLEAELVFGAGAQWMTVLAGAPAPTRQRAVEVALAHGCDVIFDTILDADPAAVTVDGDGTTTGRWIALHSPFDTRGTSVDDGAHIARVAAHRATGHRISLAGGIGPGNFAAVIAAAPDIAVIGSSVSAADDPEGTAAWLRQQLS